MDVSQRIARFLEFSGGEWSLADFLALMETKKVHLLEYEGLLVCVEVQVYPQKRILHIWGIEGEGALEKLPALVVWAKKLARTLECTELRCQGRKGWEKVLSPHQAKVLYTTLVMEL